MRSKMLFALLIVAQLFWIGGAWAQTQTPPPPQFAFTGFIQKATLDSSFKICTPPNDPGTNAPSLRLAGGTITVNGITMIIPCNSIIQMSAATFSWGDLFDPANSAPVGSYIGATPIAVPANPLPTDLIKKLGLALADYPMPFPSFDVSATGNVVGKHAADVDVDGDGVPDLVAGTDKYIVAYITPIEQQVLNGGSGIVSCIDYTNGSFRVGGVASTAAGGACPTTGATGVLIQFNDPVGRWGLIHSIDPRWSGDNENMTIHTSTGFPLCIPRVAPPTIDPLCPLTNRPPNGDPRFPADPFIEVGKPLKIFTMPAPVCADGSNPVTSTTCVNTVTPDAYQQIPLMVGDQVNWIGNVYLINPFATLPGTTIPDTTPENTYISAHTVEDVLGIFTAPGIPPSYMFIEAFLIGSGGAAVQGILQEASTRLTVVGFTSDPTNLVDIYAQDINPCTGQESLRLLATTDPATQPLVGRFVHRVLGGNFMPPTRYYVMKSRNQFINAATGQPQNPQPLVANGIAPGQYLLPNFEFVIPENHRLGDPIIPGNFQDFPFLAQGSGPLDGFGIASPIVGQLDPWPGIPTPAPVNCSAFGASPVVNAGPDLAVATGTTIALSGTVTWDSNSTGRTATWFNLVTAADGTVTLVPLPTNVTTVGNSSTVTASFTAPATPATLTFRLDATDSFGTGSDAVNYIVLQVTDTVQIVTAIGGVQRGQRGGFIKLTVTATTSDPTAILTLFSTDANGFQTNWGTGASSPQAPTVFNWQEIKGVPQPVSITVTSTKGGSATVPCTAPDAKNRFTCP